MEVAAPEASTATPVVGPEPSTPALVPPAPVVESEAPTWTEIYARYFGPGSEGSCGRSRACHAAVMGDASSAHTWLEQRGYIAGTRSPIASEVNSCLRWFGGNMPPKGKPNPDAVRDFRAWVAAGAPND